MKRKAWLVGLMLVAGGMLAQEEMGPGQEGPGGMHRPPMMGRGGPEGGDAAGEGDGLIGRILSNPKFGERLGLTPEKITEIKKAFYELKTQQIDLKASMEKAALEQARLMTDEPLDKDALMAAVEKTGQIRTEMAKLKIEGMLIFRNALTPEQREKMKQFMAEHGGGFREQMKERRMREGGAGGEDGEGKHRGFRGESGRRSSRDAGMEATPAGLPAPPPADAAVE